MLDLNHIDQATARIDAAMQSQGFAVEPPKPTPAPAPSGNTRPSDSPAPVPFEVEVEPTPWPSDCLPDGMAQAVTAIAEEVQAPVPLAAFAVISAVSHLAMRLTDAYHPKIGAMPCSLYLLSQAPSGDRKSACYELATYPISRQERQAREAYRLESEQLRQEAEAAKGKEAKAAILNQLAPDPRTIYTEGTIQKIESDFVNDSAPAMSLSTDEGGSLFGGHSLKSDTRTASLGSLTRLFDGKGVQRDRVMEGQSGFRYGVRFGLFLSAQPVILQSTLSDPVLRGQGFLPRFLFAAPRSLAGTRFLDAGSLQSKASDRQEIRNYWDALSEMTKAPVKQNEHGGLELQLAPLDPEAVSLWVDFFNDTERRQAPDCDLHHLGAFASRAGELAVRVATVFAAYRHFGEDGDIGLKVTAHDMRQACKLVAYSLSEWQAQAESSSLSQCEKDALLLLEFMHGKGWQQVTKVELGRYCPSLLRKDTQRRNAAIAELLERRWLTDTGAGLAVTAKPKASAAVAVSAVPAVFDPSKDLTDSKYSKYSDSNPSKAKAQMPVSMGVEKL